MRLPRSTRSTRRPAVVAVTVLASAGLLATGTAGAATPAGPAPGGVGTTEARDVDRGVTHERNPLVPVGASWTEHYFSSPQEDSPTPVQLHADVLRPTTVPDGTPTPVILSVGPYFSHAGQTGTETDATGPSQRFADLIEGAKPLARGYTVVMVDLRGFGGSTGCLDWLGRGEQADIKAAVEWAAAQPWSTGKVGTYGKSYDASTGLWANNVRPKGLAAVVAQEPLWNGYNYYYSNEVARPNNRYTPLAYNGIAQIPATPGDTDHYARNAAYEATHPECTQANLVGGLTNTRPTDPYWLERDSVRPAAGTTTPIFFTQGFTESNTKPEQMQDYLQAHTGVEHGWMGPWEHVRGNERDPATGRLLEGRGGFFAEVMSFYDQYLKGLPPAVTPPAFAIQGSDGQWRGQASWPGATRPGTVSLGRGSYVDDGRAGTTTEVTGATGDVDRQVRSRLVPTAASAKAASPAATAASSYQVLSKPVAVATRLTATPSVTLRTTGHGDVMVRLYDVDPAAGTGVLVDENVARLQPDRTSFELKSLDWELAPGHRLAVSVGTIDPTGYWNPRPSGTTVTVTAVYLTLETQSPRNDRPTHGEESAFLAGYVADNTVPVAVDGPGTFAVPVPRG
ncbi:CocE/NonD family hydrolase [Lapillicoccus jejuensis]|uniref:Xaa-Pro dipeptidyl-peptidase C-terminal domain-containing protein n=1 Tax=Lapillicoccus jejuensis TaxID=402171 RepID=A0A542E0B8_9MICO|nr:CocE/NonD family hydrolase [Lapillicoccus jejuensis]TQJ08783.1 hypothetical protein FB458_1875 [Lapillicoccus jejuensis]